MNDILYVDFEMNLVNLCCCQWLYGVVVGLVGFVFGLFVVVFVWVEVNGMWLCIGFQKYGNFVVFKVCGMFEKCFVNQGVIV